MNNNNNNNDHAATRIDTHGVEHTPDHERNAEPAPLFRRISGGANTCRITNGWNWRGMGAWIPSALVGLCFVNLPGQFVGPLGELAGGIDISLPVTLGTAALLYLVLLAIFPEPAAVYGPKGPRWVTSKTSQASLQGSPEAA